MSVDQAYNYHEPPLSRPYSPLGIDFAGAPIVVYCDEDELPLGDLDGLPIMAGIDPDLDDNTD